MLTEISHGHAGGDFHPPASEVRLFQNSGFSFYKNAIVVDRSIVDTQEHAAVLLDVPRPSRLRPGNDVKSSIAILKPARNDVRPAFLIDTTDTAERVAGEKRSQLVFHHFADFAPPCFGLDFAGLFSHLHELHSEEPVIIALQSGKRHRRLLWGVY